MIILYAGAADDKNLETALRNLDSSFKVHSFDILRNDKEDLLQPEPWNSLCRAASEGGLRLVAGGPNCRTWSIRRHFTNGTGAPPVRTREGKEVWGKQNISPSEHTKVTQDNILLFRLMYLASLALEHNEHCVQDDVNSNEPPAEPLEWDVLQQRHPRSASGMVQHTVQIPSQNDARHCSRSLPTDPELPAAECADRRAEPSWTILYQDTAAECAEPSRQARGPHLATHEPPGRNTSQGPDWIQVAPSQRRGRKTISGHQTAPQKAHSKAGRKRRTRN
jgi:hypothetical protein